MNINIKRVITRPTVVHTKTYEEDKCLVSPTRSRRGDMTFPTWLKDIAFWLPEEFVETVFFN